MAIPERFARREFRRHLGGAGDVLAPELQKLLTSRVFAASDPRAEFLSILEELRALGHRLAFSPVDSDDDLAVWVAGDLAVWAHGEVTAGGEIQRIDRIEILWQKM